MNLHTGPAVTHEDVDQGVLLIREVCRIIDQTRAMQELAPRGFKVVDVAGVGEGYNRQVDQDFWHDDGTVDFAELWKQTADSAVFRS